MKITIDTDKIGTLRTIKSLALSVISATADMESKSEAELKRDIDLMLTSIANFLMTTSVKSIRHIYNEFDEDLVEEIIAQIRSLHNEAKAIAKYVIERNK